MPTFGPTFSARPVNWSITGLCFSPDGSWVAAACLDPGRVDVRAWRTDETGEPLLVSVPGAEGARGVAIVGDTLFHLHWTQHGRSALFATRLEDGHTEARLSLDGRWSTLAGDPDRGLLAIAGPAVRVLDAATGITRFELPQDPTTRPSFVEAAALCFGPAGLYVYDGPEIHAHDVASGTPGHVWRAGSAAPGAVQVAGDYLYATSWGSGPGVLLDTRTGSRHLEGLVGESTSTLCALSADGSFFAIPTPAGLWVRDVASEGFEKKRGIVIGPLGRVALTAVPHHGGWIGWAFDGTAGTTVAWLRVLNAAFG